MTSKTTIGEREKGKVCENQLDNVALKGETRFIGQPTYRPHGALPIMLQAHGDPSAPISFRNVWVVERRP